jgi:hypothetical protein
VKQFLKQNGAIHVLQMFLEDRGDDYCRHFFTGMSDHWNISFIIKNVPHF